MQRERRPEAKTRGGWRRYVAIPTVLSAAALTLVLVAARPAEASPTIIEVDRANPACSDTGPGSADTPLCTIGAGAARAVGGDVVLVASGTYDEQVMVPNSGTAGAPIVLAAAPGASVTVQGATSGFRVASKSWIEIRGFHVLNTTGQGIDLTRSSNITVEGNEVSNAGTPALGSTAHGISLNATTSSLVTANETHDNSDSGIFLGVGSTGNRVVGNTSSANARGYVRAATGIDVRAASNTVADNVSFANEDSGINVWDGANGTSVQGNLSYGNADHGIDVKASTGVLVVSNTVYGNVASGIEVFTGSGALLANNIVVENGIGAPDSGNVFVDAGSAGTTSLDYDVVNLSVPGVMINWAGVQYASLAAFRAATGQEAHGLEADPTFAAAGSGDFQLLSGSPAIDSANSAAPGQPDADAIGSPRTDDPPTPNTGAGPRQFDDRGAFELLRADGPLPSAPGTPTIDAAGANAITFSWAPPVGSAVSSYRVFVHAGTNTTPIRTINTGTASSTRVETGLTAGTLYRIRVAATNRTGTGPASPFSAYAVPPFETIDGFTTRQFLDFAGRAPNETELAAWRSALEGGSATPTGQVDAATGFANWAPIIDPFTRLYYAYFRRGPDTGGLNFWAARRRAGTRLSPISDFFASSDEFKSTYGSLSNRAFVELVYNNVLGRAGEPGGVDYWTRQLDTRRRTRGAVMIGFSESGEHIARRAGEVATVSVFYGMLRRTPTAAEIATWAPQSRTSKSAVIGFVFGTAAYDARA